MNLVQLQDDLRMLPMPVLQSKAQGQDPSVPPWLATAVLNERMNAQKKAGMAQGAAQGQQPSVAEQLEQKAGLMALQAQQQQQSQQQMMQQMAQAPQPAPEQVPQPEAQPEPEQMMASGGIARLPINPRMFNYKEGGVIGFADAGKIPERLPGESFADYRQRVIDLQESQAQAAAKAKREADEAERLAELARRGGPRVSPFIQPAAASPQAPAVVPKPAVPAVRQTTDTGTIPSGGQAGRDDRATSNVRLPMSPELEAALRADAEREGIGAPVFNIRGPKGARAELTPEPGLPSAVPQPPQPAPQAGLATLPVKQADALEEAKRYAAAFPMSQKQSWEDRQAERRRALQEAGLPLDVADRMKEGIGRYEAESERIRQARQKADDIYVLSARGGLGEIGQRFAEREKANIAADTIRNDKANEMRMAMEAARRAEAMGDVEGYRKAIAEHDKAQNEYNKAGLTAAAQISGDIRREGTELARIGSQEKNQAASNLSAQEVARINAATATKPSERERVMQRYLELMRTDKNAAEQFMQLYERTSGVAQRADSAEDRNNIARQKLLLGDNGFMYIGAKNVLSDPNATKEQKERAQRTVNTMEQAAGIQPATGSSTRMRFDAKGNPIP